MLFDVRLKDDLQLAKVWMLLKDMISRLDGSPHRRDDEMSQIRQEIN